MLWFAQGSLSPHGVLGYAAQDLEAIAAFKPKRECEAALEAYVARPDP